jgi:phage baseplate assembly protein W
MVLGTPKGSVPYYREFGLDMEILDKPMNLAQARARTLIREAVERWVPQCTVNSVSFTRDDFTGKMTPTVEVEITDES